MLENRFIGTEAMTADEKGRVGIPAKFIAVLRAIDPSPELKVGLAMTPDSSIKVMPMPMFNTLLERWEKYNDEYEEDRLLLVMGPASADTATLDKQNRIRLTPTMLKHCGIERDVVVVGSMKHMQIFSQKRFDALYEKSLPEWGKAASLAAARERETQGVQYVINATPDKP